MSGMPPVIGRYRLVSVRCAIEWQFLIIPQRFKRLSNPNRSNF